MNAQVDTVQNSSRFGASVMGCWDNSWKGKLRFKLWTQSYSETCKNVMRVFDLERAQNLGPKLVSSISQGSGSLSEHSALNTYQIKCLLPLESSSDTSEKNWNHLFRLWRASAELVTMDFDVCSSLTLIYSSVLCLFVNTSSELTPVFCAVR